MSVELTPEIEEAVTRLWRLRETKFHDRLEAELRGMLLEADPLATIEDAIEAEGV